MGMTLLSAILDRGLATQTTWIARRVQRNTAPRRMLQSQRLPVWAMQSFVTRNRLIVVLLNITHTMVWSAYHLKNPCHNEIAVGVVNKCVMVNIFILRTTQYEMWGEDSGLYAIGRNRTGATQFWDDFGNKQHCAEAVCIHIGKYGCYHCPCPGGRESRTLN